MGTPDYSAFYAASTGAGAALLGLLFVSVSLAPERTVYSSAPWERRAAAASAFTALVNALFVSLGALLPTPHLGTFVLVMSAGSLLASLRLAADLVRERAGVLATMRRGALVLLSVAVYGVQGWNGLQLLHRASDVDAQQLVAILVVGVYGLGLLRAWELLGAQRTSLLGLISGRPRNSAPAPPEPAPAPPEPAPADQNRSG